MKYEQIAIWYENYVITWFTILKCKINYEQIVIWNENYVITCFNNASSKNTWIAKSRKFIMQITFSREVASFYRGQSPGACFLSELLIFIKM